MSKRKYVDTSELEEYVNRLKNAAKYFEFLEKAAQEIGNTILEMVVDDTPIGKTGHLHNGWKLEIEKRTDGYDIIISNCEEYSSYVEYGHRTPDHRGWVRGKFMLTKAEIETYKSMPDFLEQRLIEELQKRGL